MNQSLLRALPALLISLFALSFTSCSSLGDQLGIPSQLTEALDNVTGFSTEIGDWQSKLGGMLDGAGLEQLKGYADQAKNLGGSLEGMTQGLNDAMADPLGAITSKLSNMGGLDVDSLKEMVPADKMKAVDGFTSSASEVGTLTQDFMKQFGSR